MNLVTQDLLDTLESALPLLRQISEAEAAMKPVPGKWSKKEILGHLIDSASNNHQKFVRTMHANSHVDFVGYAQNFWVEAQVYQASNWLSLIDLWEHFNRHLTHIIQHTNVDHLNNTISIDGSKPFTLEFLMRDYGEHLKHHLNQILPGAGFKSSFENIYNT